MNRRKKNPPIKEQIEASEASGYFLYSVSALASSLRARDREKPNREKDAPPLSRQPDRAGMTREAKNTHPGQTSYLLTDPPDTIRYGLFTFNDGAQKRIGDFHKHRQSRYDDGLNIRVGGRNFWRDTAGERRWERACVFLDLLDHLFIDLVFRRAGRNGKRLLIYEHKTRR